MSGIYEPEQLKNTPIGVSLFNGSHFTMLKMMEGFVKRDEIAWIGTHRHDPKDNEPYVSSYVFTYVLDLPVGTREIKLPANDKLRVMAVSVATEGARVVPAGTLYMSDFADKLVVPPSPPAVKSGTGGSR
jgi:hypothetical protein